jgi:hypothetical protein
MMRTATSLAVPLLLALAACAPERWQNPNLPEAYWSDDEEDCREVAEGTAEHEYAIDQQESPERSLDYNQPIEEYDAQMNEFAAEGLSQQTFRRCMMQKGYALMRDKQP